MIKLRHFLQPVRTIKTVGLYVRIYQERWKLRQQFKDLQRERRDVCWCGGQLESKTIHRSYRKCEVCGSCVNVRPPRESELQRIYSLDAYWRQRQQSRSAPPIEDRAQRYRDDGRLDLWLKIVQDYGPSDGTAVEIGCAPGVLLADLQSRGFKVKGVEVDPAVSAWIVEHMHVEMETGLFPGPLLPSCNVFMAFDVLEHVPRPDAFMQAAADLTLPGGIIIIQTPIDRGDGSEPFVQRPDMFDDLEHLYLYTDRAMQMLADRSRLQIVDDSRALWEAGEICVFRKP